MREALARIDAIDPQAEEIVRLRERLEDLEKRFADSQPARKVSLICFSGEWDRLFAAFVIANGALAMGQEVDMFFTFWAAAALRDGSKKAENKRFIEKLLGSMLPAGPERAPLSKMNFCGLGKIMLRRRMKAAGVDQLDELMAQTRELGGKIHLCEMSSDLLGIRPEELLGNGGIEPCGVASFLNAAMKSRIVLFI